MLAMLSLLSIQPDLRETLFRDPLLSHSVTTAISRYMNRWIWSFRIVFALIIRAHLRSLTQRLKEKKRRKPGQKPGRAIRDIEEEQNEFPEALEVIHMASAESVCACAVSSDTFRKNEFPGALETAMHVCVVCVRKRAREYFSFLDRIFCHTKQNAVQLLR